MTIVRKRKVDKSYEIYLALYQGLTGDGDRNIFRQFSSGLEDMKDDMLPLDEMKQRALHEYEALQQGEKHRQRSSIFHKLAAIAVFVICLIGGSFLFSVFAPTLVSSANDFMKRAGIWGYDVLRLGMSLKTFGKASVMN
jgi:hypothetical protein